MKQIIYSFFMGCVLLLSSCKDDGPSINEFPNDKVAFTYRVSEGELYQEDFYIGSSIQFENISSETGNVTWDFGDGTTTNEQNPVHRFKSAQTYDVSLTVDGHGKVTRKVMISDIFPTLTSTSSDAITEVNVSTVELGIYLPNPESLDVDYTWIFPAGTHNEAGDAITEFKGENPGKLTFSNIGSQRVVLKTKLGGRTLEDGFVNVQVGNSEPSKTLYYAVKGGNLMAYKLASDLPAGTNNYPFDLGVKSGNTPMNILCDDSLVYVLDPGKQFTYINDEEGIMGDGKVSVISRDGAIVENFVSNAGKAAFNDPFYGYLDKNEGAFYISDRNTGIRRFSLSGRNQELDPAKYGYFVQNDRLLYYKNGYDYGAMNACITKHGDMWYWCKTNNGNGVFRFKTSDINTSAVVGSVAGTPYSVLLSGFYVKSMAIDAVRGNVFFVIREKGIYVTSLSTFETLLGNAELTAAVKAGTVVQAGVFASDDLGSAGEYVDVSQITIDEETGAAYFAYRESAGSPMKSGIYMCHFKSGEQISAANIGLDVVVEGVQALGVTINNTKSKLF